MVTFRDGRTGEEFEHADDGETAVGHSDGWLTLIEYYNCGCKLVFLVSDHWRKSGRKLRQSYTSKCSLCMRLPGRQIPPK